MGNITTAASEGDLSGVKRCVERGDDIHTRDKDGWTALHYAAYEGHRDICEYLIREGADVTIRDTVSFPPIHTCTVIFLLLFYSGVLQLFTVLLVMVTEIYVNIS